MSLDIENLTEELKEKIEELEDRVSLLEDPMRDVPERNFIKDRIF